MEEANMNFADLSAEARRLEKKALPKAKVTDFGDKLFDDFDVTAVSIKSFSDAVETAKMVETGFKPVRIAKAPPKQIKPAGRAEGGGISEIKSKFAERGEKELAIKNVAPSLHDRRIQEEKPSVIKEEPVKGVNEEFNAVDTRKEEREKRERIKKMKKEIEDMLNEEE